MKKLFLFISFLILIQPNYSQDTIYITNDGKWVADADQWAKKFIRTMVTGEKGSVYKATEYNMFYKKISEGYYADDSLKIKHGEFVKFYEDGAVKCKANYIQNQQEGLFETYYPNGVLKRTETYTNGLSNGGTCYDSEGKKVKFYPYEILPHFKECSKYIAIEKDLQNCFYENFFAFLDRNLVYPAEAKSKNIQGKVIVGFVIESDGTVSNVMVIQGIDKLLDDAAIAVIKKLPVLVPAKEDGVALKIKYKLPINFTLR